MINIKSPQEIEEMKEAGRIAALALQEVLKNCLPGKTLKELDLLAEKVILAHGAKPSFKMEKDYYWTTCMCLNDVVVHGIPTDEVLKEGDVLCVDLGAYYGGWHGDTSWTIEIGVGSSEPGVKKFLETGKRALKESIKKCVVGNCVGDISQTMQEIVEGSGYSCVRQLVGHGVGHLLHEEPEVLCFVRGKKENTPKLKEGMVLAVEVIYNMGKPPVVYKNTDGWTIVTKDGSLSAVFEHTVAITESGPLILTRI